jgi:hypothetical protein
LTAEEEGLYRLEADVVYEQPVGGRMGHFVVDRLTIRRRDDGPPITTEGLRELPIAAFLRLAVEGSLLRVGRVNTTATRHRGSSRQPGQSHCPSAPRLAADPATRISAPSPTSTSSPT